MPKSTEVGHDGHGSLSQPWQTWPMTMRYLLIRFAQAGPNAILVWLAYAQHH